MGSRLRENPSRLIECWCEIVAPQDADHPAWIIQKFPRTYEEAEILKSIPQFTFPCSFEKYAVQHFSFVLTNLESKFLYGFCRHAPDSQTAIVILSHLPWHELFYKILNHCSSLMSSKNCGDLWSFLQCLYQTSVPSPGTKFTVDYSDDKFFVAECPNHISLPSIPENRNLSEYYNAVDVKNMMLIFASMLNERRIIVTSERVSRLSACVQAANSLIYPMSWQHIFIPVLPQHLLDYLNAPMPYLIGVAWNLMLKVRQEELGDIVILNADTNEVTTPFSDLQSLPEEVLSSLKKNLNPANNLIGDSVARAFLKAVVQLIGNYREALQFRETDKKITFNREKFVTQRPPHFQPFVHKMLELQIFTQFIEERLELLNSGLHTSDEFELEASVYGEKSSSKVKQILSNVRKESGAIMKNVKSKTNPAMKSAVKSVSKSGKNVREKSLITYKEIRGKLKDIQQKNSDNASYVNGVKPRSAPSSPTYPVKRPPMKSISGVYEGYTARATYQRASQPSSKLNSTSIISSKSLNNSQFQSDSQKTPSPQEIDLLGEMRDVLNSQLGLSSTMSMSITETASNSSLNSSILSSEASSSFFSSDTLSNYPTESYPLDSSTSANDGIMPPEGSKPLNASNTSLPLLDLSLDIPLPPPLFPPSAAIFPKHSSVTEERSSTRSRHSSFRSPKIFPPETFGSLPSSLEEATNCSTPDILLMGSPKDEEFDPLVSKDVPPSDPSQKSTTIPVLNTSLIKGYSDGNIEPTFGSNNSNNNFVVEAPGKLKPDRFLPFSSFHETMPTRFSVQNPSYSSHELSFPTGNSSRAPKNLATSNSNPAALFAASLLVSDSETSFQEKKGPLLSKVVKNSPFVTSESKDLKIAPERDLLGDFSADFKKLSFASRSTLSTSP